MDQPCGFIYNPITQTLSWSGCSGADEYVIQYSLAADQVNWTFLYKGLDTSCNFNVSPDYYAVAGVKHPIGLPPKPGVIEIVFVPA
ncbi:MAG: hypothetical protein NT007_00185 [Candidatus Kapabacteria bacterium]|nr:hypothetical protein [Candidatus Kapabacteria bacterium]